MGSRSAAQKRSLSGLAVVLRPFSRTRSGRVVVIVHGGGCDRFYALWYVIAVMLDRGHTVITAHLPGHGIGGKDRFSLPAARRRLDRLIAAARAEFKGHTIVLIGQSLGASLALDAILRGARPTGVVAVSPVEELRVRWSMLGELRALGSPLNRALEFDSVRNVLPPVGPFGRNRLPVRVAPGASYVTDFARAIRQMRLVERLRNGAGTLPPLLVVHGKKDGIVPPSQAQGLAVAAGVVPILVPRRHHFDLLWDHVVVQKIARWVESVGVTEQSQKRNSSVTVKRRAPRRR